MLALYNIYRGCGLEWIIYCMLIAHGLHSLSPRPPRLSRWPYILLNGMACACLMPLVRLLPYTPLFQTQGAAIWAFFAALILVTLTCAGFFLRGNPAANFGYDIFYVVFLMLYKLVCSPFYSMEAVMPFRWYAAVDVLLTLIHLLLTRLLTALFTRVRLEIDLPVLPKSYALALLFPIGIFAFFIMYLSGVPMDADAQRSILCALLLVDLPIIYYIFAAVIRSYNERKRLDIALTRSQVQLEKLHQDIALDEKIRKERHELKNNYFYIQTLIRERRIGEAEEYLSSVIGKSLQALEQVSTGNAMLDHILNHKIAEAREKGIPVCTEIVVRPQLSVDEDAMCTILLNLLDNAIEASAVASAPDLRVSIREVPGYLLCRIANRTDLDVLKSNPSLATTKKDKNSHGLGLKIVSAKVSHCSGSLETTMQNGYFTATVMLPLNAGKQEN